MIVRQDELVAQLVEQRPFKAWVLGSSPSELTTPPGPHIFLLSEVVGASARGAVAVAEHDAQKSAPRPNCLPVLVGEDPRQLVQVVCVVGGPGSQQLRERHWPEDRML